jgi:integrase
MDALLFVGCGYLLGLRRAEILRLHADHVTPRSLQIGGLERKGGGKDALDVPSLVEVVAVKLPHLLPDQGERWLDLFARRVRRGGPVFDWYRGSYREARRYTITEGENDPQWCYRRIDRWARELGLPTYRPHDLRHGFCTNMLKAGLSLVVVSRLAAHSSVQTTMRYIATSSSDLRDFLADSSRPFELERRF